MSRRTLTDAQWERIAHLAPGKKTDKGVTAKDNRRFVDAVLRMARRGAGVSVEYTFHPLITAARSGAAPTTGRLDLGPVI